MVEIEIIDSVWTRTSEHGLVWLNTLLSYDHFYWRRTGYGNEKVVTHHMMVEAHSDGYFFLTGLVDRVLEFFDKKGIEYKFTDHQDIVETHEPKIEGYVFRPYQQKLVDVAVNQGRGQILAATGTGKSIVLLGIMSSFPNDNILFLVHTKDLVKQMKADVVKAFPDEEIGEWSAKTKNIQRITVATIQSYIKIYRDNMSTFQVILIDEAHHISGLETMYAQVLQMSMAHTKIGVTATQSANEKGKWAAEALLGPVLGTYNMKDAADDDILARPTIHIYTNPYVECYRKLPEYEDKYEFGIIDNHMRNLKIIGIAKDFIKKKKTTLITVTSINHGLGLERLFRAEGMDIQFIYGKTSTSERDRTKEALKNGEMLCSVASVIFLEGIDIPSLDVVINAGAGVSPVQTMQRIGRALRKTKNKDTAVLVDFIDKTNATLERQSNKRIEIYKQNDWPIIYQRE
jgi:superfamily II DNA or RNA helicase